LHAQRVRGRLPAPRLVTRGETPVTLPPSHTAGYNSFRVAKHPITIGGKKPQTLFRSEAYRLAPSPGVRALKIKVLGRKTKMLIFGCPARSCTPGQGRSRNGLVAGIEPGTSIPPVRPYMAPTRPKARSGVLWVVARMVTL
jgi:hypothetical protein